MSQYRRAGEVDPLSRSELLSAAEYIKQRCSVQPLVGIICGSGLGGLADTVENPVSFNYKEIPGFPVSSTPGHQGRLVLGYLNSIPVILMQGRFHAYEGYPLWKVVMPVRIMKLLGIKIIIVTNAAGAINKSYKCGDIMLVRDHLNMAGVCGESPLRGPNDESFGPRFFSVQSLYPAQWRNLARQAATEIGALDRVKEGILTISGGPNFESTAELRMLANFGADCVGMSSIPECLTAGHCGVSVLAFCLVTNLCSLDYEALLEANHEEVLDVGRESSAWLNPFLSVLVKKIAAELDTVE